MPFFIPFPPTYTSLKSRYTFVEPGWMEYLELWDFSIILSWSPSTIDAYSLPWHLKIPFPPLVQKLILFAIQNFPSTQAKWDPGIASVFFPLMILTTIHPHSSPLLVLLWNTLVGLLSVQVYTHLLLVPSYLTQDGRYYPWRTCLRHQKQHYPYLGGSEYACHTPWAILITSFVWNYYHPRVSLDVTGIFDLKEVLHKTLAFIIHHRWNKSKNLKKMSFEVQLHFIYQK